MGNSVTLWGEMVVLIEKVRRQFGLRRCRLMPLTNQAARMLGDCEISGHGIQVIRLRLHRLGRPRVPLSRRTIMATLSHEASHLAHPEHGPAHRALTRDIRRFLNA